ncbi:MULTISPECIES: hypothetical protein [Streptomyces]|uniref:hypothetical protein n=1 Tax=Streptomyces TaxID=1883 RepID=UPI0004AA1EC5|nr:MULTISPECIES: hypothetical protein [Streptomyces]
MSDQPSSGFRASPDELRQTGGAAAETASGIPGELKALVEASHQSVAGMPGLRCATALGNCTGAWNTLLTDLHTTMSRQGQGLVDAANGYGSTDRQISTAFGPDTRTAGTGPTAAQQQNFVLHFG